MVITESMESGGNPCYKDRDRKTKSRNSKKEKSGSSKPEGGDEPASGKTRKSHRTVFNNINSEKDKSKVRFSLLILNDEENDIKNKSDSNKKFPLENENTENFETSVNLSGKQKHSSRTTKTDKVYKIESIIKNPNPKHESTKDGGKVNKNIKSVDKEKAKIVEKSKKESKDSHRTHKPKSSSRQRGVGETTDSQLISEKRKDGIKVHTDKSNSGYRDKNENTTDDPLISKIKTKEKADSLVLKSSVENYARESDRSEIKKENRERNYKRKIRKADDVVDSVAVPCPEVKKSRKGDRRVEKQIDVVDEAVETTKTKERSDNKSKHKREKKEDKENGHNKRKRNISRGSGESDQFDHRSTKLENDRYKKQEKFTNGSSLSEISKIQIKEKKKNGPNEERETRKHKGKSKKSRPSHRSNDHESDQVSEIDKPTPNEPSNGNKISKKAKFECLKDNKHGKSVETLFVKQFHLNRGEKDPSEVNAMNKASGKQETYEKNDKYIKVFHKEDVLLKGMQDLTVKELYLMENLKDYEIKLNEQFLKKIKKKRREPLSTSDNLDRHQILEKSTLPAITNLPVCKLPSVKEIFKISNLADYEKSYKEMQDKRKKKYTDTKDDVDFGFSPFSARKKLNKFSLESKEGKLSAEHNTVSSTTSSQWLSKNYQKSGVKNEGGGEHLICNVNLLYGNADDRNVDQEKKLETGDAGGPSNQEVSPGFTTASKTGLGKISNCSKDLERNANYLKMCQKFHTDIREDSKKLLENLAGNKNVRVSIKDSSVQSIKKKPSLSTSEGLCTMKSHNFDYVLLKKPKRDLGDCSSILRKYRTEIKDDVICEPTEGEKETIEQFPWNLTHSNNIKGYFENNSSIRAFDKNVNKNAGVFIKNESKSDSTSPDNFYNFNKKYKSGPLSSQGNFTQSSVDYNLSSSSYSLSMFDRIKDLSVSSNVPLRNPGDLDLLKRCDVSREHPEINILRKRDKTKSRIDDNRGAWFQRSSTLERIINEIEDFPEKDTDPSCNLLRESKFDHRSNKTFAEIEKSNNVLLSYISHVNYNSPKKDKNRNNLDKDEKKINDHLTNNKDNIFMPNRRKYRDSLCYINDLDSLETNFLNSSVVSIDKAVERSRVISKSCADMETTNNERDKKGRTNVLEASLQSASTTFKCDLKAEERENVINTKLVISDPSKTSNILQIQFCGKLNINFNKDKIELGNVDNARKPLEIKYTEGHNCGDKKLETSRTKVGPEDLHFLNAVDCTPGQRSSEGCLNNKRSSRAQSENSLCHYSSISNSSSTIVWRGKRDWSLSRGKKSKHLKAKKEKRSSNDQIEEVIATEMNKTQISDKLTLERTVCPDNFESTIEQKSNTQSDNTVNTCTTSGEHDNQSTVNNNSNNEVSSLSATKLEILKECPSIINLGLEEEKADPTTQQQNVSHSKSELNFQEKENSHEKMKTLDKSNIFVSIESLRSVGQDKSQADKSPVNLDACVQTVGDEHSDLKALTKLNVLCCDVETCTSSTFELKESENTSKRIIVERSASSAIEKGEKSYSFSTDDTVRTSAVDASKDVTTGLSEGSTSLMKENIDKENVCQEIPLLRVHEHGPGIKVPALNSGDVDKRGSVFVSESSHDVVNGSRDPARRLYCPKLNVPLLQDEELDRESPEKLHNEKKKLLLSQSEEDAFKYLLLKGIGRTDKEETLSTNSAHELSECCPNPKVMFSALRKRLENFTSKAGDAKLISEQKRTKSSKQRKFSAIENRTKPYTIERECPDCKVCRCGKLNGIGFWDTPKSTKTADNLPRNQMLRIEPHITKRSVAPSPIKPVNQKHYREDSLINNLTYPSIIDHCISEYDLGDMSEEMLYGLRNLSERENIAENVFPNQYSPANKENGALSGHQDAGQKQMNGNSETRNLVTPPCFRRIDERDSSQIHYDRQHFIDDLRWPECVEPNHTGQSSVYRRDNRNSFQNSTPCCLSHKYFSSDPTQNKYAYFRAPERSFSNRERQTFSNDTFHCGNPNKKQCKSTNLSPSGDLRHSKHLIESLFYNMENNSTRRENSAPVEEDGRSIDNPAEEEKKSSRKYKISKHASKIWKSLFKKSKKYGREILEYEDVPPQQFISQRPKITENKLKIKKWLKKISQSKANDFQNVQDKLFKKLNKIMSSEVTMPLQEVFDIIQKPQFHRDNHSYSGRKKFDRVNTCNYLSNDGHYIIITEKLNVRGFLVSIGLKDDVAWEAQDNAELNIRLQTAINEARSWVNKITMSQGLLIYILAVMTPSQINNYYLQIVEAIINSRISNVGTLLSVMMVLKRYERGKYGIKTVISREHVRDLVPKQVSETEKRHQDNRSRFIYLYNIAKRAAGKVNMKVDKESAGLLARLTASYSPGLRPYLSLLAHYIAQKVISDKGQLAMAVSYLQSLHITHFDQEVFEKNCGLDQNKVVIKRETLEQSSLPEESEKRQGKKHNEKRSGRTDLTERMQASWVKRRKTKPLKESSEKITTDKSTLERKPSTMDLLKQQNKTDT